MYRLPVVPKRVRYLAFGVALALVVAFSIVPLPDWVTDTGPFGLFPIRQHLHLLAYAGLALALGYVFVDADRPDWQLLVLVFVVATVLGLGLELLQSTLEHRTASSGDVLMNAAGATVAVLLWRVLLTRTRPTPVEFPVGPLL
ncbi:VanZ family protein [Halapricum hydrolyticum]|uniref:VanZ family protein n=1 Tax=Halapricum hydrolyticum TaxID=2979991 RepID=A0AAE3ICV5_9EURY|nr:VanZ family protein [Halapricum hydrolyticum]MCU4719172.1 VanZ family protein [Halapricum hydrolyticum]MCU4728263.1 VanZ family protein [Halapricum hydrolyticum]